MVAVFAADHGVHAQGVTPWPQEVTAQMVANFLASGAVVNAIAAQAGAEVCVVDVGVAADLPAAPGLLPRKVRPGTADMTAGPAMTLDEARRAVEAGIEIAARPGRRRATVPDHRGHGHREHDRVGRADRGVHRRGRGAGHRPRDGHRRPDAGQRKVDVVRRALEPARCPIRPIRSAALAAVGGLEHAALAGFILGGAALRVPVVLDGVIACAAALAARAFAPDVTGCLIAGHLSTEPGARRALDALGLRPLLDLGLRLGEGSGAVLALPVVAPRPGCCATWPRSTAPGCPARRHDPPGP